jgi:hypothetical protein
VEKEQVQIFQGENGEDKMRVLADVKCNECPIRDVVSCRSMQTCLLLKVVDEYEGKAK